MVIYPVYSHHIPILDGEIPMFLRQKWSRFRQLNSVFFGQTWEHRKWDLGVATDREAASAPLALGRPSPASGGMTCASPVGNAGTKT